MDRTFLGRRMPQTESPTSREFFRVWETTFVFDRKKKQKESRRRPVANLIKHFTIVNFDSTVITISKLLIFKTLES